MRSIQQRLERLRGGLPPEEPGARGIERVARDPECFKLKALTIVGITPATAAHRVLGMPEREGQSPFALALGNQFERRMLESAAAMLFTLYREKELLAASEAKIVNVDDLAPGSDPRARRRRETETRRILEAKRRADPDAPNLILKPRLQVALVGVPHAIEPDYLVAADAEAFYRVGELKSYADRDGKTEPADIRSACRQTAVGIMGLRQELERQGVRDPSRLVPAIGDLVLRAPGSFNARLRTMSLEGEIASLERAVGEAPRDLEELEALLPPNATLSDPAILGNLPNHYRPTCKEHCDLWRFCRNRALTTSQPIVLGDLAAEQLAAAGTITRALDLLNGRGAPPRTAAEAALATQLREADTELRRALGNA
jgi:hypothetical protein